MEHYSEVVGPDPVRLHKTEIVAMRKAGFHVVMGFRHAWYWPNDWRDAMAAEATINNIRRERRLHPNSGV